MADLTNISQTTSIVKAGQLVTHNAVINAVWATDVQSREVSHGIALNDCKVNEQCKWITKGEMSSFNDGKMPDVYMKSNDNPKQITLLDLYNRILEIEKRLNESGGDGK